ncbi:hypothetical protein [Streptomyces sp. NRRL WC-3742]|uniref:hypothetical protein n=1 Tax=Streptomyces sp. NRRL WC-3742 TaxID=1463934 RepID=UPI00131C646F|nr:hypothetical protein [Streptomyces sp. NRRL WC-3742]
MRVEFAGLLPHFAGGESHAGLAAVDRLIDQFGAAAVGALVEELETPTVRITDRW